MQPTLSAVPSATFYHCGEIGPHWNLKEGKRSRGTADVPRNWVCHLVFSWNWWPEDWNRWQDLVIVGDNEGQTRCPYLPHLKAKVLPNAHWIQQNARETVQNRCPFCFNCVVLSSQSFTILVSTILKSFVVIEKDRELLFSHKAPGASTSIIWSEDAQWILYQ